MDDKTKSSKHEVARNILPEHLRPVFDDLVATYRFQALRQHGTRFVSDAVLADLVRDGWRREDAEAGNGMNQIPAQE